MKTVQIVTAFTLTHNDGRTEKFAPGRYELEDAVADHFYVRVHSDQPPKNQPLAGTREAAKIAADKNARRKILEAAIAEASEEEIQQSMADHVETVRRRVIQNASQPVQKT